MSNHQVTLSCELLSFIMEYIHSVEHLEILLLLKSHPERSYTAEEVSQELRTNLSSTGKKLTQLKSFGLLKGTEQFQYGPKDQTLTDGAHKLAHVFQQQRHKIIEAIFTRPKSKALLFAEAFKIIKEDPRD